MYVYLYSLLGAFAKLRNQTISFVMSVCHSAWNNSATTRWIFMKLYTRLFLTICAENSSFIKILKKKKTDTLLEDL